MQRMHINPGGRLDPLKIIGRNLEIARFWKILDRQGLIISAERRIGKTHIVLKMHEVGHANFITFYQDLEHVHSILELIKSIYSTVERTLTTKKKIKGLLATAWGNLLPSRFGDIELPQAKNNWKSLLTTAINDVVSCIEKDQKVVFIWDEFPLMLYNINKQEGSKTAIELLDQLRASRQLHGDKLRFLFTGSIGLHLILRALHSEGNSNNPINDMYSETVPPMAEEETIELAHVLLAHLIHQPLDSHAVAKKITELVGGFPYYVHHVVDQLDMLDHKTTVQDVEIAVDALLFAPQDPAHLRYYIKRIDTYYKASEKKCALAILDSLAVGTKLLSISDIVNLVFHSVKNVDEEEIRETIRLLHEDHYIEFINSAHGRCCEFRWAFLKRWWKENRL